ncbi:uncharacterized protein [Ptychodera flava]|uniref:uncharacterized protein n=1 Tax=Ptychodera flava TaxID=63121 RepID=UPI00396A6957
MIGKSFTVDMDHHNCSANSSKWLEMAHGCEEPGHHSDHDVEDGHDHCIIREFSSWLTVSCVVILMAVFVVGTMDNVLVITSINYQRKQPTGKYLTTILSVAYLVTCTVCVPMALAGILNPNIVMFEFCLVHEVLSFSTLLLTIFVTTLISVDRHDLVKRYPRRWLNSKKVLLVSALCGILSVSLSVGPTISHTASQGDDSHGCHLWTNRVDSFIWYLAYCVGVVTFLSLVTVCLCYYDIFKRTVEHVEQTRSTLGNNGPRKYGRSEMNSNKVVPSVDCNVSRMPRSSFSDTNESTFTGNVVKAGPLNGKPVRLCFPANGESLPAATAGPSTSGRDQTESDATTGESQASMRNSLFETKPDRDRMHRKVMKTSFIIIFTTFAFLFQWLIVNLLVALDFPAGIPSELRVLAMVLAYIPAALDPIIWMYAIPAIRRHTRNVFQMFRTHCFKCFSGVTGQAD